MLSQGDFVGKVAIVTGAGRGIGSTIAQELANAGAIVASADILSESEWTNPLTSGHTRHHLDVRSKASCVNLIAEVLKEHGRIDHLVNNAGIVRRAKASEMSETDFTDVIEVNLTGTFFMSQAVYPELKKNKGTIVNIGSTSGHSAVLDTVSYSASKAGVMFMAKSLAFEWATDGIRVNAVGPTIVPSDMTARLLVDQEFMKEKMSTIPLGRMAEQLDVANAVLFLLGPRSAMVTGQTIFIDGGVTIH
jgi:NAD(P)-dependent dehydrogenase (short-subunit alcohol dehydrogenase family)